MPQRILQLTSGEIEEGVMCLLHHRVGLIDGLPPATELTSEFWDRAKKGIRFMVDGRVVPFVTAIVPMEDWKP